MRSKWFIVLFLIAAITTSMLAISLGNKETASGNSKDGCKNDNQCLDGQSCVDGTCVESRQQSVREQIESSPSNSESTLIQDKSDPGHEGLPPGQDDSSPGLAGLTPGKMGSVPGKETPLPGSIPVEECDCEDYEHKEGVVLDGVAHVYCVCNYCRSATKLC